MDNSRIFMVAELSFANILRYLIVRYRNFQRVLKNEEEVSSSVVINKN